MVMWHAWQMRNCNCIKCWQEELNESDHFGDVTYCTLENEIKLDLK